MPPTTVEEWLDHNGPEEADGLPHRCKKIIKEWTTDDGAFVTCCADDGSKQTHRLVAMSSLSRRACYKCGNVGHYAEVCSSAERLCYNCKFPRSVDEASLTNWLLQASNQVSINLCERLGLRPFLRPKSDRLIGHESNGCPLPRTTEAKQCYHCQGLGHVQADCPTLRLSGAGTSGRCYNCGQPGHLAVGFKGYKIGRTLLMGISSALAPAQLVQDRFQVAVVSVDHLVVDLVVDSLLVVDLQVALVQLLATSAVVQTTSLGIAKLKQ